MDILKWLKKNGYEYTWNFKIGNKTPDIIAFKDKEITVFEFRKKSSDISKTIEQCSSYLQKANKAYIVLPAKSIQNSLFKPLKEKGIGLIGINKSFKIFLEAKLFSQSNKTLMKKLKNKSLGKINSTLESKNNIKEKIIKILKKHPEGLTIQDLSNIIGAHRQTITKYILILEDAGIIYRRRIGAVTLHYLKDRFEALKNNSENKSVQHE